MKSKNFEIHEDDMVDFAEQLGELQLENRITGSNEEDDMVELTVFYTRDKIEVLQTLIERVKGYGLDDEYDDE